MPEIITEVVKIDLLLVRSSVAPPPCSPRYGNIAVQLFCRKANVEKIDAGPKGVVIQFRNKEFANPGSLISWIGEQGSLAKIRPDQSIVLQRDYPTPEKRLKGAAVIISQLAKMVEDQ